MIATADDAVDVALRDGGTVHLRSARREDRAAIVEFYQHLSPESRYFRFFGKPRVDDVVGDVMRAVESQAAATLVGEIEGRIIAIGQFFATSTPEQAEVAFAISDAHQLRGAPLLRGYRGAAPVDEAALRDVLLRVSALIDACPQILELDINPLKVLPTGACAVDARIRLGHMTVSPSRRVTY